MMVDPPPLAEPAVPSSGAASGSGAASSGGRGQGLAEPPCDAPREAPKCTRRDVPQRTLKDWVYTLAITKKKKLELLHKFWHLQAVAAIDGFEFQLRPGSSLETFMHGTSIYMFDHCAAGTLLPRYVATNGVNKALLCVTDGEDCARGYPTPLWDGNNHHGEYLATDYPIPLLLTAYVQGSPVVNIKKVKGNRQFGFELGCFTCTKVFVRKMTSSYQVMPLMRGGMQLNVTTLTGETITLDD